jgi:hypothetical protein
MDINNILISTGFSSGLFGLYKLIQHYRLKSECNKSNQLIITIVDTKEEKKEEEKKEEELKEEKKDIENV